MDVLPLPGTDRRQPLTTRQQAVYDFIVQQCLAGYPPSIRDIGLHIGTRFTNGVQCHLRALQAKGWIEFGGKSRGARPAVVEHRVKRLPNGSVEIRSTGPLVLTRDELFQLTGRPSGPLQQAA